MAINTIKSSGSSDNRVDIIFLGDGYTSSEINTTYKSHIDSLTNYLFTENALVEPFFQYQNFFNIHSVSVVSQESGTDDPNAGIFKNTALDSTFRFDGVTQRLLYVDDSKTNAALNDAIQGTGVDAEMKFVTINTDTYGGGGGTYGVYAGGNSAASELALHEIAHSFVNLADEYGGAGRYTGPEPSAVNVTTDSSGAKWSRWADFVDPNLGAVGAYEGGFYKNQGVYRPTENSKMLSLGQAFDPIAKEAFVLQFYEHVDPMDTYSFKGQSTTVSNPGELSVSVIDENVIDVEWKVDGNVVGGDQTTYDTSGMTAGTYTITARAYDSTGLVRYNLDKVEQTVTWTVTVSGTPTTGEPTVNADNLLGTTMADTVDLLAGNDLFVALAGDDTVRGNEGNDTIYGGDDNDLLIGDAGVDYLYGEDGTDEGQLGNVDPTTNQELFAGKFDGGAGTDNLTLNKTFSDYNIVKNGEVFKFYDKAYSDVAGLGRLIATATNIEQFEGTDLSTLSLSSQFNARSISTDGTPPANMSAIRDFDGNDLGSSGDWKYIGKADMQYDDDLEFIYINQANGRWASVGPDENGRVDFGDHGQGGETRVVGIYIDPEVELDPSKKFGPFDSQQRFQNDLRIDNLTVIDAFDFDGDGFQEIYFKVNDGSAYLRALMHADGNIQYANYQSSAQVETYLTDLGYDQSVLDTILI